MKVHVFETGVSNRIVECWYDRSCQSWAIRTTDARRYQIGDAVYVGTKQGMRSVVDSMIADVKKGESDRFETITKGTDR